MQFRILTLMVCFSFALLMMAGIASAETATFLPVGGIDRSYSVWGYADHNNNPLTPADVQALSAMDDSRMKSDFAWAPWTYWEQDNIEFWFDIDVSDMKTINDVIVITEWKTNRNLNESVKRTNIRPWNAGGWYPYYGLAVKAPGVDSHEELSVFGSVNSVEEVENLKLRFQTATAQDFYPLWNQTYWAVTRHDYLAIRVDYTSFCEIALSPVTDPQTGDILIEWTYGPGCDKTHNYFINYKKGNCDKASGGWNYITTVGSGQTSYLWDSSGAGTDPDSCDQYCVEVIDNIEYSEHGTGRGDSGLFHIDNAAPHAEASGPAEGFVGYPVGFSSAGSHDNCGIEEYYWTFGDGKNSSEENPEHIYGFVGTYEVALRVADPAGNTGTDSLFIDIFLDNAGPVPVKTVGDPKMPWDGSGSIFYDLGEFCAEEGRCWWVSLDTEITMDCEDMPEEHSIGVDYLCYQVGLDGDDVTGDYCNGSINPGGWCCTASPKTIRFEEESEHRLAYTCTDMLNNTGPADEEFFKVEGTRFEIQLNKKWNLISVPFVLWDDDVEEVFEDLEEVVRVVWTYDPDLTMCGMDWCVYSPDGINNDNLNSIQPGWGYWVLANKDDTLVVAGSLFSPIETPPSRNIVAGWNLIGYYGTEGLASYNGPNLDGEGKPAYNTLCSLGETWWHKGFTSLVTYWEPYNPDQWIELGRSDYMNPGAGYWMLAPEPGIYAYSTSCDWQE